MQSEPLEGLPKEPGIYVARRKSRNVFEGAGWKVVEVTRPNNGDFVVWQIADDRQWEIEQWEWLERIWPGS